MIRRRSLARGALWAAPALVMTTAAPAFAVSACDPVSGSYGTVALVRNPPTSGVPFAESANQATPELTQVYADNRAPRTGQNTLQYVRTIPLQLAAGCCYTFTSSSYASAANPYSTNARGITGLIYFEDSIRFGVSTRGQTYSDWPGLTQVTVPTNPANGVTTEFSFSFCATETRVHNYYQFFRVAPSGPVVSGQPGTGANDDLRFNALTITTG